MTSAWRCSVASAALDEPLAATAPVANAWLVLEQPGPWGRRALLESHLPRAVGARLAALAAEPGVSVLLARRPGRHADDHLARPRRFWLAGAASGSGPPRMRTGQVDQVEELLRWDLDGLAEGVLPPAGSPLPSPVLFVCTNSRRDLCCALAGRDLVADLACDPEYADAVWECSHLGGHRFAPSGLLLPWGLVHGRLDAESAREALDQARVGRLTLGTLRGRSPQSRPQQAAEIAVRAAHDILGLDDLLPARQRRLPPGPDREVLIRHRDGRGWLVRVRFGQAEPARPESCGGDLVEPETWTADPPLPCPVPPAARTAATAAPGRSGPGPGGAAARRAAPR